MGLSCLDLKKDGGRHGFRSTEVLVREPNMSMPYGVALDNASQVGVKKF